MQLWQIGRYESVQIAHKTQKLIKSPKSSIHYDSYNLKPIYCSCKRAHTNINFLNAVISISNIHSIPVS